MCSPGGVGRSHLDDSQADGAPAWAEGKAPSWQQWKWPRGHTLIRSISTGKPRGESAHASTTHRPNTATVESGLTLAVLYTAPHPVATPQPSRHTWGWWWVEGRQFVSGLALEFYTSPPPLPPLQSSPPST